MAQIYDISKKITNELPKLTITEQLTVTINNRKTNVLNVQAMADEVERKEKAGKPVDDMAFIKKGLDLLIGERNADELEAMDLPLPEFKEVYQTIMSIATGTYGETPNK
ncbi:MAG: hypothetical protein Q4F05_11230 [bacterium]|nr:hypothetical protein [bacterium]